MAAVPAAGRLRHVLCCALGVFVEGRARDKRFGAQSTCLIVTSFPTLTVPITCGLSTPASPAAMPCRAYLPLQHQHLPTRERANGVKVSAYRRSHILRGALLKMLSPEAASAEPKPVRASPSVRPLPRPPLRSAARRSPGPPASSPKRLSPRSTSSRRPAPPLPTCPPARPDHPTLAPSACWR